MQTMTKSEERELLTAVKEAVYHVGSGLSPVAGVVKVAQARRLPAEHTRRVVEAFNVNATLSHFAHAKGAEKAATFPVADVDAVLRELYPSELEAPAKVASRTWCPGDEYYVETRNFVNPELPSFCAQPRARSADFPPEFAVDTAVAAYSTAKRAALDAESALGAQEVVLLDAVEKLAECFTGLDGNTGVLPEDIRLVVDSLVPDLRRAGRVSSAAYAPRLKAACDARAAYVSTAYTCAARQVEEENAGRLLASRMQKLAGLAGGVLGSAVGSAMVSDALDVPKGTAYDANMRGELEDPDMAATRKGMQAQVMLKSLVEDDEVLRHAPQDEVVSAYNEISQLAPTVAGNQMLARGWLRKVVESRGLDPFDIHELIKTEKDVRAAQNPAGKGMPAEQEAVTQ